MGREEDYTIEPGSNLNDAKLANASLRDAILVSANLADAQLTDAILYSANLNGANLIGTIMPDGSVHD